MIEIGELRFTEVEVTPPPICGSDEIDLNPPWHHTTWKTSKPMKLGFSTEINFKVNYDLLDFCKIRDLINTTQKIRIEWNESTYLFPLGVSGRVMHRDCPPIEFEGYLNKFSPSEFSNEEQPEAMITIGPIND